MALYKQKGSEIWHADIRHAGQRVRRSTGTADRLQAQRRHDELRAELWALRPDPEGGRTWGEAVIAWTNVEARSDSELLSLAKFAKIYANRPLSEVTRDNVDRALSFCRTAGTYMRYRTMIAAILNLAKTAGWLSTPPVLAVRRDKKRKKRDWLTHDQWAKLYVELPAHLRAPAMFAVQTGLRQANVLQLTWNRVDLARRVVWVEAEDTKADEPLTVPLNDAALAVLVAQRALPPYRPAKGPEAPASPYVFTYRGKPVGDVKTAFMAACCRAGLGAYVTEDGETHYEGFTWHGLRHTWATWHAQSGTPLEVLQKLGGWADPRMVQNYAHHSPGFIASYANNVSKSHDRAED